MISWIFGGLGILIVCGALVWFVRAVREGRRLDRHTRKLNELADKISDLIDILLRGEEYDEAELGVTRPWSWRWK